MEKLRCGSNDEAEVTPRTKEGMVFWYGRRNAGQPHFNED
jgi:hypothetical protein